eukprot:355487-Chlamydomonas_euryale.AAC.5
MTSWTFATLASSTAASLSELTRKLIRALLRARAAWEGADGCGAGVSRPRADCASTRLATPGLIRAARPTTRIELRPPRPIRIAPGPVWVPGAYSKAL